MRIDRVFLTLQEKCRGLANQGIAGVCAQEIAEVLHAERSNVSRDLNLLVKQGRIQKIPGKPTLFFTALHCVSPGYTDPAKCITLPSLESAANSIGVFSFLVGCHGSMRRQIEQAEAAVLYPPHGLHALLLGETGVGKSTFAELMYQFALEKKQLPAAAPFVAFNCADYASNPQLLLGQLFGVAKGAYTGAERERAGIIEKANGGVLFLDEVHRLPPEGQEMLFYLIDHGMFRRLGEENLRKASVLIIAATTEDPTSCLLKTFVRRIPMVIHIPNLEARPFEERLLLVCHFFHNEARRIGFALHIKGEVLMTLCLYDCTGNIGQLHTDIQLSCAGALLYFHKYRQSELVIGLEVLPDHVKSTFSGLAERKGEYITAGSAPDLIITGKEQAENIGKNYAARLKDAKKIADKGKVAILVMAYGQATAANMAEAANHLIGVQHAYALDIPLTKKPEDMLMAAEEMVRKIDQGKGVLLLVDMFFLKFIGEIIMKHTAIPVAAVEMVSTLMVLEAIRQTHLFNADLDTALQAVKAIAKEAKAEILQGIS